MKYHKRPNIFIYFPLVWLLKVFAYCKGQKITKKDKITTPSFVLSNHTSFYDFVYTTTATYPKRVNYLAADKMFYDPVIGKFLRLARAIPKCLFQQDLVSIRATKRIINQKGVVGIFPEGQISAIGRTNKPPFAIAKLIKKTKIDVFLVKHYNAYFVNPPWSNKSFPGPIQTVVEKIISASDTNVLSEEQIYKIVYSKLAYDASEYNAIHRYHYRVNKINNLESLIYRCPNCGINGLIASNHQLKCNRCHQVLVYQKEGTLNDYKISELYDMQQQVIHEEIEITPNYQLKSDVILQSYRNNKIVIVGQGTLTLTKSQYIYEGLIDGEIVIKTFATANIPYLPSDIGKNIQIYEDYQLFQFQFQDRMLPTMYVIAGEYLYLKQSKYREEE